MEKCNKFKVGQIVRATVTESGYVKGVTYRLTRVDNSDNTLKAEPADGSACEGSWIKFSNVEHWVASKDNLLEDIAEYQAKIDEAKSIIAWMDDVGATEYDPNEFKVWQALSTIENSSMSKLDKVKAIASLLN